jgi:phage I-like protein
MLGCFLRFFAISKIQATNWVTLSAPLGYDSNPAIVGTFHTASPKGGLDYFNGVLIAPKADCLVPNTKVTNMAAFYSALVQALEEATQGETRAALLDDHQEKEAPNCLTQMGALKHSLCAAPGGKTGAKRVTLRLDGRH